MIAHDISLPGSRPPQIAMRKCCKCGLPRTSDGGVELRPGLFTCRSCWRRKAVGRTGGKR